MVEKALQIPRQVDSEVEAQLEGLAHLEEWALLVEKALQIPRLVDSEAEARLVG